MPNQSNPFDALQQALHVAALKCNQMRMGWSSDPQVAQDYADAIEDLETAIAAVPSDPEPEPEPEDP